MQDDVVVDELPEGDELVYKLHRFRLVYVFCPHGSGYIVDVVDLPDEVVEAALRGKSAEELAALEGDLFLDFADLLAVARVFGVVAAVGIDGCKYVYVVGAAEAEIGDFGKVSFDLLFPRVFKAQIVGPSARPCAVLFKLALGRLAYVVGRPVGRTREGVGVVRVAVDYKAQPLAEFNHLP